MAMKKEDFDEIAEHVKQVVESKVAELEAAAKRLEARLMDEIHKLSEPSAKP